MSCLLSGPPTPQVPCGHGWRSRTSHGEGDDFIFCVCVCVCVQGHVEVGWGTGGPQGLFLESGKPVLASLDICGSGSHKPGLSFLFSFKTSPSDSTDDNLKKGAPRNLFVFPLFRNRRSGQSMFGQFPVPWLQHSFCCLFPGRCWGIRGGR